MENCKWQVRCNFFKKSYITAGLSDPFSLEYQFSAP